MKERPQIIQTEEERLISNLRERPLSDPQAQALYEKFIRTAFSMNGDQQDLCMRLYTRHLAGIVIPDDWGEDRGWIDKVGINLNTSAGPKRDGVGFWQDFQKSFPEFLSEEEAKWLVDKDPSARGSSILMFYMGTYPKSGLAPTILASVHTWK